MKNIFTSLNLARFLRAYAFVTLIFLVPFVWNQRLTTLTTDKVNFISQVIVLFVLVITIVMTSLIIRDSKKDNLTLSNIKQDIQNRLNSLYHELNAAECDLHCFESPALDSGEANWVRDQYRYIESLKQEVNTLQQRL